MFWRQSAGNSAVFEIVDDEGAVRTRLAFLGEEGTAACECVPSGARWVFSFANKDRKLVRLHDGDTNRVIGSMPLSWLDCGTLDLDGAKYEWEYPGWFTPVRHWVRKAGDQMVMMEFPGLPEDLKDPTEISITSAGSAAAHVQLLASFGLYLKLLLDSKGYIIPRVEKREKELFDWVTFRPEPVYLWSKAADNKGFILCHGDEEIIDLSIEDSAAVSKLGGFKLVHRKYGSDRKISIRDAATDVQIARYEDEGVFDGYLHVGNERYHWECTAWHSLDRHWVGSDGRPVLTFVDVPGDIKGPLELKVESGNRETGLLSLIGMFLLTLSAIDQQKPVMGLQFGVGAAAVAAATVATAAAEGSGFDAEDAFEIAIDIVEFMLD